jgi:hypothetical protein
VRGQAAELGLLAWLGLLQLAHARPMLARPRARVLAQPGLAAVLAVITLLLGLWRTGTIVTGVNKAHRTRQRVRRPVHRWFVP